MTCPNIKWINMYGTPCTKTKNGYICGFFFAINRAKMDILRVFM